jgi:hypothetical protein
MKHRVPPQRARRLLYEAVVGYTLAHAFISQGDTARFESERTLHGYKEKEDDEDQRSLGAADASGAVRVHA